MAFGVVGALLLGIGGGLLALAAVRAVQAETGQHLHGSLTWVPYFGGILVAGVGAGVGRHPHQQGRRGQATGENERPVSLKIPGVKLVPVAGSGPGGKVEITDIRAKLGEIRGEVDETAEKAKPIAWYAAVGRRGPAGGRGVRAGPPAGPAQVHLGRDPAAVMQQARHETAVAIGSAPGDAPGLRPGPARRATAAWLVIGGLALLGHLAGRALRPRAGDRCSRDLLLPAKP